MFGSHIVNDNDNVKSCLVKSNHNYIPQYKPVPFYLTSIIECESLPTSFMSVRFSLKPAVRTDATVIYRDKIL
jgi:hypothetical protein